MIRLLRRVGSIDHADGSRIVEAGALLLFARFGLHLWRFPTLRRLLDRAARRPPGLSIGGPPRSEAAGRIRWAIDAAARRLPGRTSCLASALAADVMLRRRGLESTLHLGVAAGRLAGERLNAHAWVESGGTMVTGDLETLSAYEELAPAAPPVEDALCAVIKGEDTAWGALGATPADVLEVCAQDHLTGLIFECVRGRAAGDWPPEILDGLAHASRAEAAREALRRRELVRILDVLAAHGVHPILFKGAALAYSVYDQPAARPRRDVDFLTRRDDVDVVRRELDGLGYVAPPYCDGELVFCQFELAKQDRFGVDHAFDVHWKISTQAIFADVLDYEDLAAESARVPALGPHARAAGPVHALLLACIHPAMHHRNEERLIWVYDVHLLASRLSAAELERFARLALEKRVAAVCAHQLGLARARFGTAIPDGVLRTLSTPSSREASAEYLPRGRRWHHEILASFRGLPRWRDRVRLAREVLLPSRQYMLAAYGVPGGARRAALLPALYAHRALYGAWKILIGRK